jgi:RluA family pseudouridine synthase
LFTQKDARFLCIGACRERSVHQLNTKTSFNPMSKHPEKKPLLMHAFEGISPLTVLAHSPDWIVVEKPAGMSIHNDPGYDLCSVLKAAIQKGALPHITMETFSVHPVHRLDRETSGIVVMALASPALSWLGRQFSEKAVQKRYLALVHGRLESRSKKSEWNRWQWPLTPTAAGRSHPAGRGKRKACTTRWRLLDTSSHYSLIQCELVTGRKHQIRRHAKLAGHPIVGDRRYGSPRSLDYLNRHHRFKRLGLHAHSLTLCLPGEMEPTTFQTKGLPEELGRLLASDR